MALDYRRVLADLRDETADLTSVLAALEASDWSRPTPAEGWSVQDQVNHLAYFDDAARLAIADPGTFEAAAAELAAGPPDFSHALVVAHRHLAPADSLAWFRTARVAFLDLAARTEPSTRLPWYGVRMSLSSSVTARIMETWAHGQDVADAVGVERVPTARLRHVCHLGVVTRGFSYASSGLDVPEVDVRVELTAPDGSTWAWGPESAAQRVTGPALDFCLVVTQRRHVLDTRLSTVGEDAAEWMSLAQAFAGVRGSGRPRGQT